MIRMLFPALVPAPVPSLPPARELARLLAYGLVCLTALIGRAFPVIPGRGAIAMPFASYLNRIARRFERIATEMAAGRLPRTYPKRARPPRPPDAPPRLRFSRRRGWVIRDLHAFLGPGALHWANGVAGRIEHLLSQPEAAELFAADPRAARLLRPLCHMLGIGPTAIPPLPPRVRKPRPKPAPRPRKLTRAEHEAILWYPNSEGKPMRLLPPKKSRAR